MCYWCWTETWYFIHLSIFMLLHVLISLLTRLRLKFIKTWILHLEWFPRDYRAVVHEENWANYPFKRKLYLVFMTFILFFAASYKSVVVQNLLAHSAAELIVLAIDGVSHLLEQGDQISPPDLFLTSHIILQGITQVSSAIIYTMDKIELGELEEEVASTLR